MRARISSLAGAITPLQSLIARRWRPQWICQNCRPRHATWRGLATATSVPASTEKPYYVTTPIFYVNAVPHVGHMYCMILADVLKRWQQMKNRDAILLTGTDEHGLKVQQAAAKAGLEPQEFCDKVSGVFKDLAGRVNLSNEIFMRTSDKKHKQAVEYAWQILEQKGYIYESTHKGWYSVSDETFYPEAQVQLIVDPPTGRKIMVSVETGKEVEWTSERNYHFRLSEFKGRLLKFYEDNPSFIIPKTRMDDIVNQVRSGMEDLSVSRPVERLTWGVRVPTDASQTMYVWLDALLNYASAAGYPFTPGSETAGGWPADVHVIGKDIIRFHCIYWPAFLMALDIPLPKQVLTTAHWTLGKEKMAKSTGNVVNPFFAIERFGTDTMRYYLTHDGGINDDADYDNRFINIKYKKALSGGLGNLASRIMKSKSGWNVRQAVQRFAHPDFEATAEKPHPDMFSDDDKHGPEFYKQLQALPSEADQFMKDLFPNRAVQRIMDASYKANVYMQSTSPWKSVAVAKNAREDVGTDGPDPPIALAMEAEVDRTIFLLAETIRVVGILLQPVMPTKAKLLLDMYGVAEDRRNWDWCRVGADDSYGEPMVDLDSTMVFPRLISG